MSDEKRSLTLPNPRGQSVVGVIIAAGIMSVVAAGIASLLSFQWREVRSLSEKMGTIDLKTTMALTLSDSQTCTTLLSSATGLTFDATKVGTANPPVINFTQIPAKGGVGTPIATVNSPLLPNVPSLVATSIQGTITSGTNNAYLADLQVNLDYSRLVRGLHPPAVKITLVTNPATPATAKVITGCAGTGWVPMSYLPYNGNLTTIAVFGIFTGPATNGCISAYPYSAPGITTASPGTWCASQESPEEICIRAGYSSYTGACQALIPTSPPMEIQGSLLSNRSVRDAGGNRLWGYACIYGIHNSLSPTYAGVGDFYAPPTMIRCN